MEYFGPFGCSFSRGGGDGDGRYGHHDDVHDDARGGDYHDDGLADCNDNCCVEP